MRGAVYYDGFNLYHAVDDLQKPHLKWYNLRRLGETIAKGHAKTVGPVVFCTAFFPGNQGKRARHEAFLNASKIVDVDVRHGHATTEPVTCKDRRCGYLWDQPREKETDINLALAILEGAIDDQYDIAFVVTADTDQAATFRTMRRRFPDKRIIHVVPPGRYPAKHLLDLSHPRMHIKITEAHIEASLLPAMTMRDGMRSIVRPREYDPPDNWVHPDDRPKKAKG